MKQSPDAAWKALAAMAPEVIEEEKERNDRPEEEHRWADLEKTLPEEKESIISQRGDVCKMGRGRGAEELRARPWEEVDKAGSTTKSATKRRLLSATGLTLAVVLLKAMVLRVFAGEGRMQRGLPIRWHAGETMAVAETWEGVKRAIEAYTGLSLAIFFIMLVVVAAAFYYVVFGFPVPPHHLSCRRGRSERCSPTQPAVSTRLPASSKGKSRRRRGKRKAEEEVFVSFLEQTAGLPPRPCILVGRGRRHWRLQIQRRRRSTIHGHDARWRGVAAAWAHDKSCSHLSCHR